jgi:hypothetical protein
MDKILTTLESIVSMELVWKIFLSERPYSMIRACIYGD